MPNAVVMTGCGPPEVLKWAGVPQREPGEGQIRIKVKAAGISPTDLALRAGYPKAIPLPPNAVLGFEAAGTVDAVGPGVTGTSLGDGVTALLVGLGGYAEYAAASIWTRKPDPVSWIDAAALPSSAEAAVGVLRHHRDAARGRPGDQGDQRGRRAGRNARPRAGSDAGTVRPGPGRPGPRAGRGGRRVRCGRQGGPGRRDRPGWRTQAGHHLVRPGCL